MSLHKTIQPKIHCLYSPQSTSLLVQRLGCKLTLEALKKKHGSLWEVSHGVTSTNARGSMRWGVNGKEERICGVRTHPDTSGIVSFSQGELSPHQRATSLPMSATDASKDTGTHLGQAVSSSLFLEVSLWPQSLQEKPEEPT